jgi:hypothetical protein
MKELGEIDMASRALATLEFVTRDDAQQAFPAVHPEGHLPSAAAGSWLQPRSANCPAGR